MLEQYCAEKISHEASELPFMSVREVYKYLCHLKQSITKGTDGLDGIILRLSAPLIAETLTYVYITFVLTRTPSPCSLDLARDHAP